MIGGTVIEVAQATLPDGKPGWRLWCINAAMDEAAVYTRVSAFQPLPNRGDIIWWQDGEIIFTDTKGRERRIPKIGNSFDPTQEEAHD